LRIFTEHAHNFEMRGYLVSDSRLGCTELGEYLIMRCRNIASI
jgi:hypothetical protein